jgi:hypothetical protein
MAAFAIWNMSQDRRAAAPELFVRSLTINPNSVMALTLGGWIEIMRGSAPDLLPWPLPGY